MKRPFQRSQMPSTPTAWITPEEYDWNERDDAASRPWQELLAGLVTEISSNVSYIVLLETVLSAWRIPLLRTTAQGRAV